MLDHKFKEDNGKQNNLVKEGEVYEMKSGDLQIEYATDLFSELRIGSGHKVVLFI